MRKKQGRKPAEPSRKGNRFQVNVLLSVEMKNRVLAAARASGRSVSREAEHQLERALAVEDALAAMHTSFAEIQKGNFEAELWRRGYTPIRQPGHDWKHWKLWAEPGFPGVQPVLLVIAALLGDVHRPGSAAAGGVIDRDLLERLRPGARPPDGEQD